MTDDSDPGRKRLARLAGERSAPAMSASSERDTEELASFLLRAAGGESVRVLEALASAWVNRRKIRPPQAEPGLEPPAGLAEATALWVGEHDAAAEVCRRIARRALRGNLIDRTGGATAFHRIDASPDWSRDLVLTSTAGGFVFYRAVSQP